LRSGPSRVASACSRAESALLRCASASAAVLYSQA
jgi:hypothetical protein